MVQLTLAHYIYVLIIIAIIITIVLKKDITLLSILGVGIIGFVNSLNPLRTLIVIYKAITVSGKEFIDIILIISLVNAMSKALSDIGTDQIMIAPIKKLMVNKVVAFFILGITTTITSWFFWPTPAVVFIGAIMVPAAIKVGIPRMWVAVILCLFGKGAALSSDFIIQGSPAITARAAGIENTLDVVKASIPFWSTMCIFSIGTAFILMHYDKNEDMAEGKVDKIENQISKYTSGSKLISIFVPLFFLIDVALLVTFNLKGDEATALIGGTSVIILIITTIKRCHLSKASGIITMYIKNGFMSGMKVFAPIIVIGAFFFLGSEDTAKQILGPNATGFLTDIGIYISTKIKLSKFTVVAMQGAISAMLGISGSGFGGLPLVGTLARAFHTSINVNLEKIAAFGQVITIWIGGGTIIPWSVVPVAAICGVNPFELAKKNLIPVIVGLIATLIMGLILI